MEDYKIFCQIGGRLVASLSLKGELIIYHDHFKDEDQVEIEKFMNAFDRWAVLRNVSHYSKNGLNKLTVEKLNSLQKEKPGKYFLD